MKKGPSLGIIFLTVLVDLIGFGIVLPLLPVFTKDFGGSGLAVGLIMAVYSAMQFLMAPFWGRLSDRIGRRPVLLLSTAAASLSYLAFAWGCTQTGATALWIFFLSRLGAGVCGANITVAQAYVADITPPAERSRRMGLIGMAFGLGFVFGPALGAVAVRLFGIAGPGWTAAAICLVNFLLAFGLLEESWTPQAGHAVRRPHLEQWKHTLARPAIGLLVGVFFLSTFCFACFETTLGLLVAANFHLDPRRPHDAQIVGYLFAYCGLLGAVVQGGLIGRLVKSMGEMRVVALSLLLVAISFVTLPFMRSWAALIAASSVLAVGASLVRPPLFGLISRLTPSTEQGATLGVAQSVGSLARIFGPVFAGSLLQVHLSILNRVLPYASLPYLICGALALLTAVRLARSGPRTSAVTASSTWDRTI
jgi:MFS family permease